MHCWIVYRELAQPTILLFQIFHISFHGKLFLLLEIFFKNFNQGQYVLNHSVHSVNFDQSLSRNRIFDQRTIPTISLFCRFYHKKNFFSASKIHKKRNQGQRFAPYCSFNTLNKFLTTLKFFPVSNIFKKLDLRIIRFDRYCPFNKVLIIFFYKRANLI